MIPIILASIESDEDRDICARLYERYKGLMMHIALRMTADRTLAEDMVSEAVIKMIRHLHKINSLGCYQQQQYIVLLVRTAYIDYVRKAKRQATETVDALSMDYDNTAAGDSNPLEALVSKDGYETIVAAILSLPDTLKDVAYLFLVHGHDHNEIANLLGISYDNSKTRLSRAKAAIKAALKEKTVR
ncbi:MAG: sigma-70 family RNA polymerase sigma factor [Defluviitaleaceae bacterium]|nr:sigma-70 family RNA polymerase sigma factor [Defluviitaleaceae bacterium]